MNLAEIQSQHVGTNVTFFHLLLNQIYCNNKMAESLSLLSSFEKILYDRIEDPGGRIHEAHNPIYNESLMIEIETLPMGFISCRYVKTRIV